MLPTDPRKYLVDLGNALVAALGSPSPEITIVPDPNGKASLALVREGFRVEKLAGRNKGQRKHTFADAESFAAWLMRHADPKIAEILVDDAEAIALLDPRVVDSDVVEMPIVYHPRFARWSALFNQKVSQKTLYKFLVASFEDFASSPIEGSTEKFSFGEKLAGDLLKFEAVRNTEVTIVLDERGFTQFQAHTDKVNVQGKIPPKFSIQLPVLAGALDPATSEEFVYDIELLLEVIPPEANTKGPPSFIISCPKLPLVLTQARADLVVWLRHLLAGKDFLVGLGKAETASVPDVEPRSTIAAIPQVDLE
jgi:hypothetical protein